MKNDPGLEKVTTETVAIMEMSKQRMHYIEENARIEKGRLQKKFEEIQSELLKTKEQIKHFEKMEKEAWHNFEETCAGFNNHLTYKQAYEQAREIILELGSLRERERQLTLKNAELEHSLLDINDHLTAVLQRQYLASEIIQAQEEERRRVAREIHDGPAQSMANVILRTEVCEKLLEMDKAEVKKELGEFKTLVHKSLQDVRRIIFDLRPMALDDLGLLPALKHYLKTLKERYSITMNIELSCTGEQQRLLPSYEVAIYRVIQEALQNTIKHAEANCVKVFLDYAPHCLVVRIIDDGKGFPATEYLQNPHIDSFGLLGMKERLEILGGELSISSQQGEGTEIMAILPLGF